MYIYSFFLTPSFTFRNLGWCVGVAVTLLEVCWVLDPGICCWTVTTAHAAALFSFFLHFGEGFMIVLSVTFFFSFSLLFQCSFYYYVPLFIILFCCYSSHLAIESIIVIFHSRCCTFHLWKFCGSVFYSFCWWLDSIFLCFLQLTVNTVLPIRQFHHLSHLKLGFHDLSCLWIVLSCLFGTRQLLTL